ncbi:CoA ester lyase [Gordonia sp. NB41Y]|uniref:HpcH/HpaI aldolase/citrate lyase family protein n=1 Tax=Gordonia sp. NB41Y TaxID=875808 RepID=UPI0006B1BC76|nr:CoA ester lyase [Gordonia sp. NB41Y]KOY49502.1 citrate lyase subunit beta [Gordonia sp. NB41Y]WLP92464.1 CoA ester lyase [Gordonia sp. NB41Y]
MTTELIFLYVPADRPERFDKAAVSGCDAVVLDLEDAVPLAAKDTARAAAGRWLGSRERSAAGAWVRVNPGTELLDDLAMAVRSGADGIWLPKCDDAATLHRVDQVLTELENRWGRPRTPVSPLIETGAGLCNAVQIAAAPRVAFVQIGEVDLAADLGVSPVVGEELLWARSQVVAASAAARIRPPLGAASPVIDDPETFAAETRRLTGLGFFGRACIHPRQIPPARAGMAPSDDEIAGAREVLAAFGAAGGAAVTDRSGRLVDEAVARIARRTLARGRG